MLDFIAEMTEYEASGRGDCNTARRSNHSPNNGGSGMADKSVLTQEILCQLIDYDSKAGAFVWRARPADLFAYGGQHTAEHNCRVWNAKYAGKPAGSVDASVGYLRLSVLGSKIWAHRAAWIMAVGDIPRGRQVDHIDGDRMNNRISNLRVITMAENRRNMGRAVNNTSGHVGVTWSTRNKNWNAKIGVNGRTVHLGCFEDIQDAVAARRAAEREHGFHENHGSRIAGYAACGGEIATEAAE